jgi:RNA-directed DNA polymerase
MSDKRQKNQLVLAFPEKGRSEAPKTFQEGTESRTAKCETERPASHEQLMEEVCERENCWQAYKRVKANKGSPGIDGMKTGDLSGYLRQHWPTIREQLLCGTYKPEPVRRVEIPKPDGGVRKLGIPTVLDRFIQQAVMQVLQRGWDPTFSEHSHGFRPKRSAHQAVAKAQKYIAEGHRWVVDLDIEKFFDRVHHEQTDGGDRPASNRQESAPIDRSTLEGGCDGEWAGESGGRRDTARWAALSALVEYRARRTRP